MNLARRYGVSRIPLREALQILTGEGLVTGSANRGVRVRALLPKEIDEIFCIRRLVEGDLVSEAAGRLTSQNIGEAAVLEVRIPFTSNFKSSNRARNKPSRVCSLEQRR
jgi:DNA-binding GntR family transcriptional regulator